MIVINLWAGPGSGKSTTAAYLFTRFKMEGKKAELVGETAKDMIYEGRTAKLDNQFYVSAVQYTRLRNLAQAGCDIAISDSPLRMQLMYAQQNKVPYLKELSDLVFTVDNEFDNVNCFIQRAKPYQTFGRLQTEDEAKSLDKQILILGGSFHHIVFGDDAGQRELFDAIKRARSL